MRRILPIFAALAFAAGTASAQIVTAGCDPGSLKWSHIRTADYDVIYPKGLDSLARVYAESLERVKLPVSGSIGFVPNQSHRTPMPVVLHAYTANSNGMVAWTPRQMHLYTTPDPFTPQALPWVEQLTVHESRHVAQMQYVTHGPFKPFYWFTGELFGGAAAALYCGPAFFEGDAVAAETELSGAGRGRSGDFLEYQRACFLAGDTRDFWRWRYGSQRLYTPDYYRAGYLMIAGMRTVYDAPDFTKRYYDNLFAGWWPFPLFVLQKTVKDVSGKSFRDAFSEICDNQTAEWRAETDGRGPAMHRSQMSEPSRLYTSYTGNAMSDGKLWSIRSGMDKAAELVCDGKRISAFSASTSQLKADSGRIWWSEIIRDPRWEMRSWSDIWYRDENGGKHRLTRGQRYYNPAPCGQLTAATEYPVEGGSAVVELNASDGSVIRRHPSPDSLQVYENVWLDSLLYAAAVGPSGNGIYSVQDWSAVLGPSHCSIGGLFAHNGRICFRSDLCGVGELYSLNPSNGETYRLTNTGNGASGFQFSADSLYCSSVTPEGKYVYATPVDSLVHIPADFSSPHRFSMAEKLSESAPTRIDRDSPVGIGEPQHYSRLVNAIHFHSWLPCYVNVDNVQSMSFESISSVAGLGATGLFQNALGTLCGTVAYHPYKASDRWIHEGEVKLTYRGLYPIIEGSFNISSGNPVQYWLRRYYSSGGRYVTLASDPVSDIPSISGSLKMYVPLSFSSGGWSRGLVPQVSLACSNSIVNHGSLIPYNRTVLSLRGYTMQSIPSSCIYPRWGLGLEGGYAGRLGLENLFTPNAYAYAYGYVPGILRTHGIRLTAIHQWQTEKAVFCDNYTNVTPRGYSSCTGMASFVSTYSSQSRLTVDYAFPFAPVDWSFLGPVAYIRNFEFYAQGDLTMLSSKTSSGNLFSLGGTLLARLGNLLWVPYTTRIGVSCYWNGGTALGALKASGANVRPVYVSATFSIDL